MICVNSISTKVRDIIIMEIILLEIEMSPSQTIFM